MIPQTACQARVKRRAKAEEKVKESARKEGTSSSPLLCSFTFPWIQEQGTSKSITGDAV